ncbi:3-oxoacyl-ACP synthase [Luteibacter rhizovicinus DSM 16549]|uniref:3-oxoacyl-ACP synthase n=1 Tax=Luteibacter rhizovicinus DSM 16549 TaxID=1440763 RepID=A0A0G9HGL2_9GAMM|nr:beta-ketoacyl synthase chain length factor [Luteibacter rhizovicinus]APG02650.1 3-oxoacyl-ACP synthase [Luteibacter rhizovicinus DSM 16549]KLD68309.1 3-oxoacyl-ACP synthase [Luteibacter rhizovicinus DSM 16549]KLD74466.1 3-oxoacyl-ACP synthase [Xanthomonas hyacinthi DSM 19077]
MIELTIERWRAWAPGVDDPSDWAAWSASPRPLDDDGEQPSCDFVAPMQRRRLSRLARIVMHTAWPMCADDEQLPFVFASRHGETTRTFAMLDEIGREAPLSPTQFGLSVHNAIAGQWSILRGQRGESVAIAGEADTFEHAIVEAAALLGDGAPAVVVVIAEERPASAYDGWIDDVPFSYAVALRVSHADGSAEGPRWRLSLRGNTEGEPSAEGPHALRFVRALHDGAPLDHPWKTRRWTWQPVP